MYIEYAILAEAQGVEGQGVTLLIHYMVTEIGIGVLVGLGVTALAVRLMQLCWDRGWITKIWGQVPVVMLAILCFTVAQSLHGSGYIAAFVGGILFGIRAKEETQELLLNSEGVAELLAMLTWVVFGASVIYKAIPLFSWQALVYALLSLTVVRMLPIFLSLTGSGETTASKLFLGWFGPRGFASIVFAIIVLNSTIPGAEQMAVVVVCTVILSALAHGISANPLAAALGSKLAETDKR